MPRSLRPSVGRRRAVGRGLLAAAIVVGTVIATVPLATVASASPGWSAPTLVDNTTPARLPSVSCPTASFCMALNGLGGSLVYNGTKWSAGPTVLAHDVLASVSCASSTFCAATDFNGNGFIYNGHSWSAPAALASGAAMPSVSCAPGTTFCVAVAGDTGPDGYIYSGGSWSSGVLMDTAATGGMASVSCPTASFCMAFDNNGNVVKTTDGGSVWSPYSNVDSGGSPQSVSCDTTSFCAMVDNDGNAFVYNGGSFTTFSGMDGTIRLASVSCASSSTCVAIDVDGNAVRYSSGSWSAPHFVDYLGSPTSVSCPTSTTFCVAVDNDGGAVTSSDGGITWSTPAVIDEGPTDLQSVSCVSSIFCAAVDDVGNVLTYNGSSWSAPAAIDSNVLESVSCASATLCVAVDDNDDETTFDGTSWSAPNSIDPYEFGLNSVSCTATPTTFCVAVDDGGNAFTSDNGSSWSSSDIDGSNPLESVSCATASFCAAVDAAGNALTWDGSGWTSDGDINSSNALISVSCTTAPTTFCTAVGNVGSAVAYHGISWSAAYHFDTNAPTAVSCPTATSCIAVDNGGDALTWNGAGNTGSDWSPTSVDPGGNDLESISCPSASFCVAVDDDGNALVDNGPGPAVTVSEVSPDTGPTTGSTPITISGSGFALGATVHFAGVAATSVHVVNTTTITASSPPGSAGTVDVIVTTSSGSSTPNPADQFTYTVVQSPSMTGCDPSCSETVSTPLDQTQVTVSASSDDESSQVSLVVNTDTLDCGGRYDYATPVSTVSSTNFAPGATVSVTDTVGNEPSTKGVKVCYSASSVATSGSFLARCPTHHAVAPCIVSLHENLGSVVATLLVPATDPRFWTGTGNLDLTSFSPTQGAPGKKLTIKGADLTQVTAVVIGGAQANILKLSKSKVTVKVPQGAVSGTITVTADSGDAISAIPFTVT